MVSALMLAVLFFKLGVEQRLRQIGILRAAGYSMPVVRRLLLGEAIILAVVGAVLGIAGAVLYGKLIVYGLGTWWVGAVGTTMLELHVRPLSLVLGAVGGRRGGDGVRPRLASRGRSSVAACAADGAVARRIARTRPRGERAATACWRRLCLVAGVALLAVGFARPSAQAGAFFGAGAALLVGALLWLSAWLRARDTRPITGRGAWAVARLGFRSAAFRPARSVLSAALIASAAFIIVSVDAFRREGGELTADQKSGTGGYVLFAESELPLLHNPNEPSGREALMMQAPELAQVRFTRFRVRPGEDASCLNLYRPTNPTIIAPEAGFIESNRFTFASSMAGLGRRARQPVAAPEAPVR